MLKHKAKIFLIILGLGLLAIASACSNGAQPTSNNTQASGNEGMVNAGPIARTPLDSSSTEYQVEVTSNPSEVKAGEQRTLTFIVKDKQGGTVKNLAIVHEKPMHLLIVSQDLSEFDHQHPEPQSDGSYKLNYKFTSGGNYLLYIDFTPEGKHQVVDRFTVPVGGAARKTVPLTEDKETTKTVDGITVSMSPDKPLKAGDELMLNFYAKDAQTSKPLTDLQPYLGALAHFVVISEDTSKFLHVHPMEPGETMKKGEMQHGNMNHDQMPMNKGANTKPTVSAHTTFPKAGLFKLWAQFQRAGRVITVPFVVRVAEGETKTTADNSSSAPSDAIKVTVSKNGYEPSEIKVKQGQTTKLAFYRADAENCGGELVIPSLRIKKSLPVGKTVIVEIKPEKTGELTFACGMDMMKGKLIVSE